MVLFARLLRVGDLDVTPVQLGDWLKALDRVDVLRKDDFKNTSRAVLVSRARDLPWFEQAFELFWQARDPRELSELELGLLVQRETEKRQRQAAQLLGAASPKDEIPEDAEPEHTGAWSVQEILRQKDFAELTGQELAEVRRLIAQMRFRLDTRRSRRLIAAKSGERLDLRRSLRLNLGQRGELLTRANRRRKQRRRPVVLLCDVSGSMEPYARLLLHFIYAIRHARSTEAGRSKVEAFVFGTHLTRITQQLRSRNVDQALSAAAREIQDWGGGTRTGESLRTFNYRWSRRVLGQGAVVLLISDGWDRGDIDLLGVEMKRLRLSCHRLIWLNPLLGSPSYEPLTRGMVAALPHIDDFLPVHNLHSLEQLGAVLASLDRRGQTAKIRPLRATA
jgi:uncharacterized protein with von Willebrand factor type A (vWA) domain